MPLLASPAHLPEQENILTTPSRETLTLASTPQLGSKGFLLSPWIAKEIHFIQSIAATHRVPDGYHRYPFYYVMRKFAGWP